MYIKLAVGKIINIKKELGISKPFKILGLDLVSDLEYRRAPEFGLFFSDNSENLKMEHGFSHYIGFNRDKSTRDYYYPEQKKTVKLYNYCILQTDTVLDVDYVSFHVEIRR
ncbi:MAG: hypothetical protein ACXWFB_11935 [Nitrososphaeraceae archaeon]